MGYGEIIAKSPFPLGTDAADNVYEMWKASPPHRAIMFSGTYNYVGIGVAQAADGTTWVAAIMTESRDHTAPVARNRSLTRSGRDVTFTWSGYDRGSRPTRPACARSTSRCAATAAPGARFATTRRGPRAFFPDRARGHWYGFRVQAADRRGTLSRWTSEIRIWVP